LALPFGLKIRVARVSKFMRVFEHEFARARWHKLASPELAAQQRRPTALSFDCPCGSHLDSPVGFSSNAGTCVWMGSPNRRKNLHAKLPELCAAVAK
jgi:hypothetical protein